MRRNQRRRRAAIAVAIGTMVWSLPATAQDTWDGEGGDQNFTTAANWNGDVAPGTADAPLFTFPDGIAADAPSVDDDYSLVDGITFGAGGATNYTLGDGGGSLSFINGAAITNDNTAVQTINAPLTIDTSLTVNAAAGHMTIGGVIDGAGGGLVKAGANVLTLTGANTFDSGVTLNAGTLAVGDNSALGSGDLTVNGGTLDASAGGLTPANNVVVGGDFAFAGSNDLTLSGTVDLGAATRTLTANAGNLTLGGVVSNGSLTKAGAGTLTLTAQNTFDTLTVNAGTVTLNEAGGNAIADGSDIVTAAGGTVDLQTNETIATLTGAGGTTQLNANTLTVGDASDFTYGGVIDGAGGVTKQGTGQMTLTGTNTFTGTLDVQAGTIVADAGGTAIEDSVTVNLGATGALTLNSNETIGTLTGDGGVTLGANTLTVGDGTDFSFDGVVDGTGGVTKQGTGAMTLTGINTFTGTLDIQAGTVVANEAGNNAIADTATVNAAAGATFDVQSASETIGTLTGAGTAQLNANDLTVGDASDFTFGGDLAGSGGFTKQGTGAMTLGGDSSGFTGATTLSAGSLVANGQLGGAVTVNAGSTLMGTGTLNGSVTNNGAVAPGNSIGTLAVGGDFTHASGATLTIELDGSLAIAPGTSHDLLDVAGDATLASGSTVNVVTSNDGDITEGDSFEIIQAAGAGGIVDNGASITTTSGMWRFVLDPTFSNGDNALALIAESLAALGNRVGGGNVGAIALVLENATPAGGSDFETLINNLTALTDAQLATVLDQLSPQPHGSTVVSTVQAASTFNASFSQTLRGARAGLATAAYDLTPAMPGSGPMLASMAADPELLAYAMQETEAEAATQGENGDAEVTRAGRPYQTYEQRYAVFARPYGVFQDQDGTGNFRGFDGDTYGVVAGAQLLVRQGLSAGLLFGYDRTELDFENGTGSLDSDNFRVGPYLAYERGDWFFNAAATWGYHDFEGERVIGAPVSATAESDYEGYDLSLYMDLGLDIHRDRWIITPMGSLQYTYLDTDGFDETGAGAANMSVDDQENDALKSRLGVNVAYQWHWGEIPVVPEAFIGWEHEFLADEADLTARFAAGGGSFTLDTGSPNEDGLYFGGGVSALVRDDISVYVRYDGTVYDDLDVHAVSGGVTFRF